MQPRSCDQFFSRRFARRVARRYRTRGLDKPVRQIVEFLERRGLDGATVLEVGGGIGEIQLELLKRGAQRTINLELSTAYEEEAARLIREAGLEGRVERRRHDSAVDSATAAAKQRGGGRKVISPPQRRSVAAPRRRRRSRR